MWPNSMVEKTVYVRAPNRVAWDLPVRYRQGSQRIAIMLHNLTQRGARVEGVPAMRVGDMAMIQLPTLAPKAARVVWKRGDSAGLAFERDLHPDVYAAIVEDYAEPRVRTIADLEPEADDEGGWRAA